jgi:hypothetical protein
VHDEPSSSVQDYQAACYELQYHARIGERNENMINRATNAYFHS